MYIHPVCADVKFQPLAVKTKQNLCKTRNSWVNRAFSLTWPASMIVYWNKRRHLHEKRVQLPEDFLGTPTWPPFHCFGTPIWPPWRHVKMLYTANPLLSPPGAYFFKLIWGESRTWLVPWWSYKQFLSKHEIERLLGYDRP